MKAVIKNVWYCFLCFFLIITIGCTGKSTKQADVKTVSCDTLTGETSATVIEEKGYAIDSIGKGKEIDLDRLWHESVYEVTGEKEPVVRYLSVYSGSIGV